MPYIRYHPHAGDGAGKFVGFLVGCLAGLVIGWALGVLLAPHRGDITRRKVARKAGQTRDQVVEKVEDLMVHRREDKVAKDGEDSDS
jgi:gas vesicle protein